jgi:hypothetical protein
MIEAQTNSPTSFLDSLTITEQAVNGPSFNILYGVAGIGKTFLCKYTEKPFFLATEKGCERVPDVGKFLDASGNVYLPKSTEEFFQMLKKFCAKGHDYKTIIIDSGLFVDKLFVSTVIEENPTEKKGDSYIEVKSIGDINFGRGYEKVISIWEQRFFAALHALQRRGISVVLIAHARDKNARDSEGNEFKKYGIDLLEFGRISVPNLLAAKADAVLFMHAEAETKKKHNPFGPAKNVADNSSDKEIRVYTRASSGFDAKVRTENIDNVSDYYVIDIRNPETSKKLWTDLAK